MRTTRKATAPKGDLTLSVATGLMRRHNPEIRKARVDWRIAQAVACVPTPYPNPRLELGPLLFSGIDILSGWRWGAEAGLGWTVLLVDKRGIQNSVNRLRAGAAFAGVAAVEREEYLELRHEFTQAVVDAALLDARQQLAEAAETSEKVSRQAVEAGSATALDVQLMALETANFRTGVVAAEESLQQSRGRLGARIGVVAQGPTAPSPVELPTLPADVPALDALQETAVKNHPRLTVLRADYLLAEKELRMEAAKAWPDLDIGLTYENEIAANRLGLPIGMELPIFDRNQPGVAEAKARRDGVHEQFMAELTAILAAVENARAKVHTRRRVLDLTKVQMDAAEEMAETAKGVLDQLGTLDMLRFLEVLRTSRRVRIEYLEAQGALFEAWSELERACGAPLLRFPNEPGRPERGEEGGS